jgi:hypothetical protein
MKTEGHVNAGDLKAIKNWSHKPLKCDCGNRLDDRHFTILRAGHSPQKRVYLEVWCDCDQHWFVDTEGTPFLITEK